MMKPLLFSNDAQFWYETLRSFGHITYGGADFGEVVSTSVRIVEGDYDSWHDEWLATADRVSGEARRALAEGHPVSARDGFLRAWNYYRSADFFLHGNPCDPRHHHAYDRSVECFHTAAALFTPQIEPVRIPYEGGTLPGYLYRADTSGTPRPTVIMHNGFDGTAEEMHFFGAMAGVERGYTVLVFDGPGQPGPLRRTGPAALRPPHLPQDPDRVHHGGGRRCALPGGSPTTRPRQDLRLAGRHAGAPSRGRVGRPQPCSSAANSYRGPCSSCCHRVSQSRSRPWRRWRR